MPINNLSIKYKLIIIILFVTIFAVGIGFSIITYNEIMSFKQDLVEKISSSATLTGRYCISAIAFEDFTGAEESLQILKTIPDISAGIIYDKYSNLFAEMYEDTTFHNIPQTIKDTEFTEFKGDFLHVLRPIKYHNMHYGQIYVIASTKSLTSKIKNYIITMGGITIFILLISILIAYKIQKVISQPILDLAEITSNISKSGDYSIEVKKIGNDEISVLYNRFNNMLKQIFIKQQERDIAEEALRENEATLKSIFKTTPVGIGMVIDDILHRVNQTLCNITGFSEKELLSKNFEQLYLNKVEFNQIKSKYYKAIENKDIFIYETIWKHKKNRNINIQLNVSPISHSDISKGIIFTALDISDRKKEEEERRRRLDRIQKQKEALATITSRQFLQENNKYNYYKNVLQICADTLNTERASLWFFGEDKEKIERLNPQFEDTSSLNEEDVLYINDYPEYFKAIRSGEPLAVENVYNDHRTKELIHKYLLPNNIYAMLDMIVKLSGQEIAVICIEKKSKTYHWEIDEINFMNSISDQIAQFILRIEQKKTLKELDKAQNYINNIINSMPSVIIGVDAQSKVTHWNTFAEKTTGIVEADAKGNLIGKLLPNYRSQLLRIKQAINQKSTQKEEKISISNNQETNYADITIYPLIANGVEGAVIRIDDVTESVNIEEMMIQSEKMLSVGGLAAGMAHEINNPLAGMLQNIQVIQNRLQKRLPKNLEVANNFDISFDKMQKYMEGRDIWAMIESIKSSGKRAAQIVENMLSFSRKGEFRYINQDICELFDKTIDLASNDYDLKKKYDFRQINIVKEYEQGLPFIKCESSKIQQVFLNLLKNGAHAMADFGNSQDSATIERPQFLIKIYKNDNSINIEIGDNGPGMEEEIRKRIFEPFFTTKPVGTGTGLGLSVSYFIITKNHNGKMSVESTPGKGTNFLITLPF